MWIKTENSRLINSDQITDIYIYVDKLGVGTKSQEDVYKIWAHFNSPKSIDECVIASREILIYKTYDREAAQAYVEKLAAKLGAEAI